MAEKGGRPDGGRGGRNGLAEWVCIGRQGPGEQFEGGKTDLLIPYPSVLVVCGVRDQRRILQSWSGLLGLKTEGRAEEVLGNISTNPGKGRIIC